MKISHSPFFDMFFFFWLDLNGAPQANFFLRILEI